MVSVGMVSLLRQPLGKQYAGSTRFLNVINFNFFSLTCEEVYANDFSLSSCKAKGITKKLKSKSYSQSLCDVERLAGVLQDRLNPQLRRSVLPTCNGCNSGVSEAKTSEKQFLLIKKNQNKNTCEKMGA